VERKKPGKYAAYDRAIEEKALPEYWYKKYRIVFSRWRKHYGLKRRVYSNPMLEVLVERAALLHIKMQYYEHPDFVDETGVRIENPMYMGKYDEMLKSILRTIEQIQKYTEAKPKAPSKSLRVNTTIQELNKLNDEQLDKEIRQIISTGEDEVNIAPGREEKKNGGDPKN
jgi:hypothetical protein